MIKINLKKVKLNQTENLILDKLLKEYEVKIKRQLKNEADIVVHIKVHEKEGNRKKYNIHIDVANSIRFGATADDWDLARAVHKVFKNIMNEIEHKLHVSDQYDKQK